jgi:hypothetical protein
MTVLDGKFFRGNGDIPPDIAEKLIVRNGSDREVLTRLGWEGQLVSYIGLALAGDGRSVTGARFGVQGKLANAPVSIQAAKLWQGVERDIQLTIELPEAAAYKFSGSSLVSDYLEQENTKYKLMRGRDRIARDSESEVGATGFCTRLFAYLDKSSNARNGPGPHIKLQLLIFPSKVEQLEDLSEKTQAAGWPGIKLAEAKADFFPKAQAGTWGAPVFPLLLTGERAASVRDVPAGDKLRFAMAALMRTAVVPVSCASRRSLDSKCQEALDGGEDPDGKKPSICWPDVREPAGERGREISNFIIFP